MAKAQENPELEQQIKAAATKATRAFSRNEVADIIRSVLSTMEQDGTGVTAKIYDELDGLAQHIAQMKEDLARSRPEEIKDKHIPTATDELDAVVGATADATGAIMDCCEEIEKVAGTLDPAAGEKLVGAVTRIYEACSFQDITGQRITKVVKTLQHIETKVANILQALGEEANAGDLQKMADGDDGRQGDAKLLNGPSLPGAGINQDEIDKLLASFD